MKKPKPAIQMKNLKEEISLLQITINHMKNENMNLIQQIDDLKVTLHSNKELSKQYFLQISDNDTYCQKLTNTIEQLRKRIEVYENTTQNRPINKKNDKNEPKMNFREYISQNQIFKTSDIVELCGGTHVKNTSEIGKFAILSLESKGSGIYRVEGATNDLIEEELKVTLANNIASIEDIKHKITELLNKAKAEQIELNAPTLNEMTLIGSYQDILNKREELANAQKALRDLEKQYDQAFRNKNSSGTDEFMNNMVEVNGVKSLVQVVENMDISVLKDVVDKLTANLDKAVVLFADKMGEKLIFVAKSKNTSFNAGMLVKEAAMITGGNGGGRPDFAQAGGKDASKLEEAIQKTKETLGIL